MPVTTRSAKAVKEGARLAEIGGDLELEVLLSVKVFFQFLLHSAESRVQLLDLLIKNEVLLFDEAKLHECRLIPRLERLIRLDQALQFYDESA